MGLTPDVITDTEIESKWGNEIRDRTCQVFSSEVERDQQWRNPPEGALAVVPSVAQTFQFLGGDWRPISPTPYAMGFTQVVLQNARIWTAFNRERHQNGFTWSGGNVYLNCLHPGLYMINGRVECVDNCAGADPPSWGIFINGGGGGRWSGVLPWSGHDRARSTMFYLKAGDNLAMQVHWNGLLRVDMELDVWTVALAPEATALFERSRGFEAPDVD